MYASPEHYRTHACHVKATSSKLFTNTMELQHKSITNLTVTHAEKVMKVILDCALAIKDVTAGNSTSELRDLQQMVNLAKKVVQWNPTALKQQGRLHHHLRKCSTSQGYKRDR